jgi:hypothetical protein
MGFVMCPSCGEPTEVMPGLVGTSSGRFFCVHCNAPVCFQMFVALSPTMEGSNVEMIETLREYGFVQSA